MTRKNNSKTSWKYLQIVVGKTKGTRVADLSSSTVREEGPVIENSKAMHATQELSRAEIT